MLKNNYFILLLLIFLPIIGYSQKNIDITAKDAEIRKNLVANPESSKQLIKEVLESGIQFHDTIFANIYVYYGFYYNIKSSPDSSLYYYNKALPYTEGYPKQRAKTLLNMAVAYRKKGEFDTSLDYLKTAEKLNISIDNKTGLGMVYGEIASNYSQRRQYDMSIPYLIKAIDYFKSINSSTHLAPLKQRLANTYMEMKNYRFALDMYADLLNDFKALNTPKNYYLTQINYGECLFYTKNYSKAKKALNEGIAGLKKFSDVEAEGLALSILGQIAIRENDCAVALNYYDKAIRNLVQKNSAHLPINYTYYISALNACGRYNKAIDVISVAEKYFAQHEVAKKIKIDFEEAKAITYKKTHNTEKSLEALEVALTLKESQENAADAGAIHELQAKYQNELQREKNISLQKTNNYLNSERKQDKKIQFLLAWLSAAGVIILVISFIVFRYRSKLQKEKLVSAMATTELIEQKFEYEQQSNAALKKSLIEKQADLVSGAMRLASVQENINEMLDICSREPEKTDVNQIKKHLEKLVKQEDYWEVFDKKFNDAHPHFKLHLGEKYPQLNDTDLFFSSLLKLKLPYKDIGRLMQISPESVVKRKYRIKKKMEIENEDEFDKILQEL